MELLLTVLGLILVLEGMPWFLSPRRCKAMLLAMAEIGDRPLRIAGLAAMLLGLLLVYAVRG